MTLKTRTHTSEFKMRVAIEALKGELTLAELSSKFEVHPRMVTRWRAQLLEEGISVFDSKHALRKTKADIEKEELERKIGQLTMEIEYLKKKLGKSV